MSSFVPCTNNCGVESHHVLGSDAHRACMSRSQVSNSTSNVSVVPPTQSESVNKMSPNVQKIVDNHIRGEIDLVDPWNLRDAELEEDEVVPYIRNSDDQSKLWERVEEYRMDEAYEWASNLENDSGIELTPDERNELVDYLRDKDISDMEGTLANQTAPAALVIPMTIDTDSGYLDDQIAHLEAPSHDTLRSWISEQGIDAELTDEQLDEVIDNSGYGGTPTLRFYANINEARDMFKTGGEYEITDVEFGLVDRYNGSGHLITLGEAITVKVPEKQTQIRIESEMPGYNWSDIGGSNPYAENDVRFVRSIDDKD